MNLNMCTHIGYIHLHVHVSMRDDKVVRKKQARSNKQTTRQSNTAHPIARQSLFHVCGGVNET